MVWGGVPTKLWGTTGWVGEGGRKGWARPWEEPERQGRLRLGWGRCLAWGLGGVCKLELMGWEEIGRHKGQTCQGWAIKGEGGRSGHATTVAPRNPAGLFLLGFAQAQGVFPPGWSTYTLGVWSGWQWQAQNLPLPPQNLPE